jgi:hypothetical protein
VSERVADVSTERNPNVTAVHCLGVAHRPDPLLRSSWQGPVPIFTATLEQYSWSTIKVDLSSLQCFHRYVLEREMEWTKLIRPPR